MKKRTGFEPYEPLRRIDERESFMPHSTLEEKSDK